MNFYLLDVECAGVFHRGGARLILCGKNWEKLEELADELASASDPTVVREAGSVLKCYVTGGSPAPRTPQEVSSPSNVKVLHLVVAPQTSKGHQISLR